MCACVYAYLAAWLMRGTVVCVGSSFNFTAGWGLVGLVRWSLSLSLYVRAYSHLTAWGRSSLWRSLYFTATCALGRVCAHASSSTHMGGSRFECNHLKLLKLTCYEIKWKLEKELAVSRRRTNAWFCVKLWVRGGLKVKTNTHRVGVSGGQVSKRIG